MALKPYKSIYESRAIDRYNKSKGLPVEKRKNDYIKYYSKIFDISLASKYELISCNDYNKIKEELEKEQITEITLNFDDFETLFYNYNIMDLCITGYAK